MARVKYVNMFALAVCLEEFKGDRAAIWGFSRPKTTPEDSQIVHYIVHLTHSFPVYYPVCSMAA